LAIIDTIVCEKLCRVSSFSGDLSVIQTSSSPYVLSTDSCLNHVFTGTSSQVIILPNATTLTVGREFYFYNLSTGVLTLKNYSEVVLLNIVNNGYVKVVLYDNTSSSGSWLYFNNFIQFGTGNHLVVFTEYGSNINNKFLKYQDVNSDETPFLIPYDCIVRTITYVNSIKDGGSNGTLEIRINKTTGDADYSVSFTGVDIKIWENLNFTFSKGNWINLKVTNASNVDRPKVVLYT